MSLAATLDLEEAAGRTWDAVVVGAGPAGALAARELALREVAVLLVDRASFPRYKVCGCCLNRRALATLDAVGLGSLPTQLGALPLAGLELAAGRRRAWLPLPGGVALSREVLDAALVTAAIQAGAAFLPATRAALAPATSTDRCLILRQDYHEELTSARLLLAADGLGGKLLAEETTRQTRPGSRLGAGVVAREVPEFYQAGTIFMACGRGGYVGLVRLEDGRLDVAAAFDPPQVKEAGGLGATAAAILAGAGLPPVPGLADLPWRGTPLLTCRRKRPAAERAFLLGDAAGYVEPFTGEGLAWALAAGAAVAPIACRACRDWQPELAVQWSYRYRRLVARHQWVCRRVAGVLRRPALTRALVAVLARAPALASPLIRYLNLPDSASGGC